MVYRVTSILIVVFLLGVTVYAFSADAHRGNSYIYLPIIQIPRGPITEIVSISSDGVQGNARSRHAAISADGRFVAFASSASNLVPNDTNGYRDIFIHDRETAQTTRVSVASDGTQGNGGDSRKPSISANGRYVAFSSLADNLVDGDARLCKHLFVIPINCTDIFVHDTVTRETTLVSIASNGDQGNGNSYSPSISGDGRFVAFQSFATNLVPDDTNTCSPVHAPGECSDIFVHDRQTGQTSRVSIVSDGTEANGMSESPSISADGRFVAFQSFATNLVPGDTNGDLDIFIHDQQTGQTTIVSIASDGTRGNAKSYHPTISGDGRFVAFQSFATNLVPGDTNICFSFPGDCPDVFVHDQQTGQTTIVSIASDGTQANGMSDFTSAISADGRFVAFSSNASNLVANDTYGGWDIFVHDRDR